MAGIKNWLASIVYPKISPKVEQMREIWADLGETDEDQEMEIVQTMKEAEIFLLRMMDKKLVVLGSRRTNLLDLSELHARTIDELAKYLDIVYEEPEDGLKIIQLENCLRKRVEEMEEIRNDRLARLEKLKAQERTLAQQLGEKLSVIPDDVLSENTLDTLKKHCVALEIEKNKRQEKLKSTREEIMRLMNELERTPDTPFEKDFVCDFADVFQLTHQNMNGVEALVLKLKDEFKTNEAEANRLRASLQMLWDVLQVEDQVRKDFLDMHKGHRPTVIKGLNDEVQRCRHLKLQNAAKYISKIRFEISNLWDRCHFSVQQRRAFKPFYTEDFTEEVLEAHDGELQRLKLVHAEGDVVFNIFKKRAELWEQMLKFEKPADDPQRFNNRGGRLLREEKERKNLMVRFPKLEIDLQTAVNDWETKHKRRFLVYGKQIMDYVRDQWDGHRQDKENEKLERQRVKARKLEDEVVNGSKANMSRKRVISTPGKESRSKLAKVTPMSTNAVFNQVPSAILTSARITRAISKSTVRKTRVLPRRLAARGGQMADRTRVSPSETLVVGADNTLRANLLGTSHLSTYSEFTKMLPNMQQEDGGAAMHPRSSSPSHESAI